MLAPAEVPPTVTPRSRASTIACPNTVPAITVESLSWLPPVMKMPVARSRSATSAGSEAWARSSGRTPYTSAAPSRWKSAAYTSIDLRAQRGRRRDHGDARLAPTRTLDELPEHRPLAELVLGTPDHEQVARTTLDHRHDRKPKGE